MAGTTAEGPAAGTAAGGGSTTRRGLRVLGVAIRREPWVFTVSTLGSVLFGALTVADAWVLGWATDNVILPSFRDGETSTGLLWVVFALFLGVALLRAVGIVARRLGAGIMQYRMQAHYRRAVTRQYLRLPMEWHHRHPTGQLLSNANSDVEAAWMPIAPLPMAVGTIAMMVIAVAQMLAADLVLALVGILVFPAVIGANLLFQRLTSPLMTRAQQLRAELSEIAHESFDGAMVVKTLGREGQETARFEAKAAELRAVNIRAGRIRAAFDPTLAALPNLGVLVVLAVGVSRVLAGDTAPGSVVSVAYLLTIVAFPIRAIGWLLGEFPRSVVGFDRVSRVLEATGAMEHGDAALDRASAGARLDVDAVAYAHAPDQRLLESVSFDVAPGRTVALVGPTASGKTTLTTLLTRLVDPDRGAVRVDGVDLRDLAAGELSASVAHVGQSAFLFDDTVRGNIALGAEVPDDEVWAALRAAQGDGFVAALPHGLDSKLGERGTSLSGGQRQRISLARALVRRPRLLILDDATSAVDPEVEARILEALRSRDGERAGETGATLVVVAYRKATIGLADEVLHLDDGRIVDRGTHAELLARSPAYAELVNAYEAEHEPGHEQVPDLVHDTVHAGRRRRVGRRRVAPAGGGGAVSTTETDRDAPEEEPTDRPGRSGTVLDSGEDIKAIATIRRGLAWTPELTQGFAGTLALAVVATVGQIIVPIAVQQTLDKGLGADGGPDVGFTVRMGVAAAVGMLVAAVGQYWMTTRLFRSVEHGLAALRTRAFRHVHDLPLLTQNTERRGSLVSRVTSDVDQVSQFLVFGGMLFIISTGQILVATVVMVVYSWQLALLVWLCFAPLFLSLRHFQRRLSDAYGIVRRQVGALLSLIAEPVVGAEVVRTYAVEARTQRRIDDAIERHRAASTHAQGLTAFSFSLGGLSAGLANAGVVIGGVLLGLAGDITAGEVVAFGFIVTLFVGPVQMGTQILTEAQLAIAGWRRVIGILETPADLEDPGPAGRTLPRGPIEVRFEHVGFAYPEGPPVLRDVDLTIGPGSRVAVVGETGSGKSTVAKLLTRLMDPSEGRVLLDGVDVREVAQVSLRRSVVLVPQEGFLFDDTIAANARYGDLDATDAQITAAAEELGLGDWLAGLPHGLATRAGQRGESLSAGERQLVALLRAQLADPDLLVLDEATSAVDPALEMRIGRALERLMTGRTSVTIAHRLSTAEAADEVIVVDDGRVVQRGSHAELVAQEGVYAGLHASWVAQQSA